MGSSGCFLKGASQADALFVASGGVPSAAGTKTSALSLFRSTMEGNKRHLESLPLKCGLEKCGLEEGGSSDKIDVGSLVRHSCIPLTDQEGDPPSVLLVGGGISSFAFGPSFSESYCVSFHRFCHNASRGITSGQKARPRFACASPTSGASNTSAKESITDVVYVEKSKAKELKNELEKARFLDKNYRMIPADTYADSLDNASRCIAVPVTSALAEMSPADADLFSWFSLIAGRGRQIMPFSTKVLGNRRAR